jgi:diguanylate cyclase (GGDEF)-like protein
MSAYYTLIIITGICVATVMLITTRGNAMLSQRRRCLFTFIFVLVIVGSACEWAGVMLSGRGPQFEPLIRTVKTIEFSFCPALGVLYAAVLEAERSKQIKIAEIAMIAHAVFECVVAPFDVVIVVDAQGTYLHGPFYLLYVAAYFASAAFLFVETWRCSLAFQYRNRRMPWLVLLFMLSCAVTQIVDGEMRLSWLGLSIGACLMYLSYTSVMQQTDSLTKLLNRFSYESSLSRVGKRCAILFIDVDDFKYVNDTFGHAKGDECLAAVAKELFEVYGRMGTCYRIGGDEFCVVVTGDLESVRKLNENLEKRLDILHAMRPEIPTVSIGFEMFDPATDDIDEVSKRADALMYEVKRKKKLKRAADAVNGDPDRDML